MKSEKVEKFYDYQEAFMKSPSPLLDRSVLHKKAQQMIRKKASLYGFQQLSNPPLLNRYNIISSLIPNFPSNHIRTKSNLPTSQHKNIQKDQHSKRQSQQLTKSKSKSRMQQIPNINQNDATTKKTNLFPQLHKLENLIHKQKQILHIFKDKLDTDINDVVFQYLKILSLSILKQSQLHSKLLEPQNSILIPTLQLVSQSMYECQFDKMTLLFAMLAVDLCQFYKLYEKIGKFLFLIAKVLRKMSKFQQSIIVLKKALQYAWFGRRKANQQKQQKQNDLSKSAENQPQIKIHQSSQKEGSNISNQYHTNDEYDHITTQLEVYNQLSYCLLQLNQKQESKVFASKYQIGYIQKEGASNVMGLSKDLIISAQKRIVSWQRVDAKRIYMMVGCDLNQYLQLNKEKIMKKFHENVFMKDVKANIDLMIEGLIKKEMFFYEIPLVTEFKDLDVESYKKSHLTSRTRKLQQRFVYKSKSSHSRSSSIPVRNQKKIAFCNEGIGENKIFNYRGVGLSRTKLVDLLKNYINLVRKMTDQNQSEHIKLKLPQLNYDKNKLKLYGQQNSQFGGKSYSNSRKTTITDAFVD